MTYLDRVISWLPDSYAKDKNSNIYKLFKCIMPEYDLIKSTCEELKKSLDISYAYGETLSRLGANLSQQRGSLRDSAYRTLILAKAAANMSNGTIRVIIDISKVIFGASAGTLRVVDMYLDAYNPEAAAFSVAAPIEGIVEAGFTLRQFAQLLTTIKACGVRVIAEFQGTFEFGDVSEYGTISEHGFADVEQTTGGTLGTLYDPEEDEPLPI